MCFWLPCSDFQQGPTLLLMLIKWMPRTGLILSLSKELSVRTADLCQSTTGSGHVTWRTSPVSFLLPVLCLIPKHFSLLNVIAPREHYCLCKPLASVRCYTYNKRWETFPESEQEVEPRSLISQLCTLTTGLQGF